MIAKQDVLDRAAEWGLRPDVVEKDYVLGWLLAAISQHAECSFKWVFKGGTCLKKCFFETYRFSEDLDFTLLPEAAYSSEAIQRSLTEVAARVLGPDWDPAEAERRLRADPSRPSRSGPR